MQWVGRSVSWLSCQAAVCIDRCSHDLNPIPPIRSARSHHHLSAAVCGAVCGAVCDEIIQVCCACLSQLCLSTRSVRWPSDWPVSVVHIGLGQ